MGGPARISLVRTNLVLNPWKLLVNPWKLFVFRWNLHLFPTKLFLFRWKLGGSNETVIFSNENFSDSDAALSASSL